MTDVEPLVKIIGGFPSSYPRIIEQGIKTLHAANINPLFIFNGIPLTSSYHKLQQSSAVQEENKEQVQMFPYAKNDKN